MFRKTRTRIVATVMGALILLFIVTLGVIVLSEYYESRREDREMLERYVEIYSPDRLPGSEPGAMPSDGAAAPSVPPPDGASAGENDSLFRLSSFYSVAFSDDGGVMHTDTGVSGLYSGERLRDIAGEILAGGEETGRKGTLIYQVQKRDGYTLVAFKDNTASFDNILSLLRHALFAGLLALAVLFFLSLFLSRRILQPLEESDRRQKQFVSDAGHELKTPVSVIAANEELLRRSTGGSEWLDNIRYENEKMGELVTRLLDLSRAENAQLPMEAVDLSRLVTGEVLPFESVAFEKGMTIDSDIAPDIEIRGDRAELSRLVSILLDNAIRHAEGDRDILLTLRRQGRHAVLTVENSAPPIPEEERSRLFERFYRMDSTRSAESGHYGLGLAIARAVTESHGGTISVTCPEGRVRFTAELPLKNN